MKKLQLPFNKKFHSVQQIGIGSNSEIYLAYDSLTELEYAIKLEPVFEDASKSALEKEAKFYCLLKGGQGISHLHWYGIEHNYKALVLDLLGPSLEQLLRYCKGTFSLKTVLLLTQQILDRIQWVHSKGLIYNDIDSTNFVIGLGEKQDKIFLIDFGSCQKYKNGEGEHCAFEEENKKDLKQNSRFKSIHSHINKKRGRRDDLESIGYLLVFLLKGKLPWDSLESLEEGDNVELAIKEKKSSIPIPMLCDGLPLEFESYFKYVRSLEFEEEPDYSWLKRLFQDLFDRQGFTDNKVLDWAERHKY